MLYCESSSVGRALAFQAKCRRFEPGLSLKNVAKLQRFFCYKLFSLFPKINNRIIGIANKTTKIVFTKNNSGTNKSVIAKPPIVPPKCAACPIFPNCFFIP